MHAIRKLNEGKQMPECNNGEVAQFTKHSQPSCIVNMPVLGCGMHLLAGCRWQGLPDTHQGVHYVEQHSACAHPGSCQGAQQPPCQRPRNHLPPSTPSEMHFWIVP